MFDWIYSNVVEVVKDGRRMAVVCMPSELISLLDWEQHEWDLMQSCYADVRSV